MAPDTLWISRREIESLNISMPMIMDAVERGFAALGRGEAEIPPKIGIHPRENSFIHAMPCHVGGNVDRCGIKCVSGYPQNPHRGMPYIAGLMILNDPETGLPQAVMDASFITGIRTGAASGVYARHCGNPNATSIAIIGTGVQGRTNLEAMAAVFPKLKTVRLYNRFIEKTGSFIKDMQPKLPDAQFTTCKTLKQACTDAEIIITCTAMTTKPERPIACDWIAPDALCIAVDYDACFDGEIMRNAVFTVDHMEQYLRTQRQGIFFQNGYPVHKDIDAEMGSICAGTQSGIRTGLRGAVLMGIASHDVMAADIVYEMALQSGVGTRVEL